MNTADMIRDARESVRLNEREMRHLLHEMADTIERQLSELKLWHPGYIDQSKSGILITPSWGSVMVLCETCGNKRCPRAGNRRYLCTHSNEPGQTPTPDPAWSSLETE